MNFFYNHTAMITRPIGASGIGTQPYQGLQSNEETIIAANIPANIQLKSELRPPETKLPGDTVRGTYWLILFKQPPNTIKKHDVITDETGKRYQVFASQWTPMGYECCCELLQN